MQHTDKYQLNLVETSDTFSPAPLNENMEKVEAALDAARAETAAGDAALDLRVAALEARRIVWGSYMGDGTGNRVVEVGFTPGVVIVHSSTNPVSAIAFADHSYKASRVQLAPGGFSLYTTDFNMSSVPYYFIAIL